MDCDVLISDRLPIAAGECRRILHNAGLKTVLVAEKKFGEYRSPTRVYSGKFDELEDVHSVVMRDNSANAGLVAAYEILAELFDDCEPAEEI